MQDGPSNRALARDAYGWTWHVCQKTPVSSMRVLHLIDSLALGGAERMAVNLCNALAEAGCEMHLCATRSAGPMMEFIDPQVRFLGLKKKRPLDLSAIIRLRRYIKQQGIQVVHTHSSSFYMGCLMKWITGTGLIWHNHNGNSENLNIPYQAVLRSLAGNFDFVFAANDHLRQWAVDILNVDPGKVEYLANFPYLDSSVSLSAVLPGQKQDRIVCTARLNWQKDHMTLVEAMARVREIHSNAQLLLVGQDLQDEYSKKVKDRIMELGLVENVHLLGGRSDIGAILKQCSIGVLSSISEGLPVALLEYGLAGLGVVCTDVGECDAVLGQGKYGKVVSPKDPEALSTALIEFLTSNEERNEFGKRFRAHVNQNYSGSAIAQHVKKTYEKIL